MDVTYQEKINYCIGIAKGMQHVADLGYIHRDLACRTILVGAHNQPVIADFGPVRMSRVRCCPNMDPILLTPSPPPPPPPPSVARGTRLGTGVAREPQQGVCSLHCPVRARSLYFSRSVMFSLPHRRIFPSSFFLGPGLRLSLPAPHGRTRSPSGAALRTEAIGPGLPGHLAA